MLSVRRPLGWRELSPFTPRILSALLSSRVLTCAIAVFATLGIAACAPAQTSSGTAAKSSAATADSAAPDPDGGWPRSLTTASGATLILYQPQMLSWEGQRELVAMAALSYMGKSAEKSEMGTMKLTSPTSVSLEERLVNLTKVQVSEIHFASLAKDKTQEVVSEIQKSLPTAPVIIALDRMLAAMDKSQIRADGVQIKTDPPPIYSSTKPAILVQFDGPPIWSTIEGSALKYVVNTNWDVFQDTGTKLHYVLNGESWLQAADLKGAWQPVQKLPDAFAKLPSDDNWKEVKSHIPGKQLDKSKLPTVYVSEQPAELILIEGDPKFVPVEGTNLLWVSNTESDLFRMKDKDFYFLVAGRWFRSARLDGPWVFASSSLPDDFRNIPGDHERARVLSSIPGTNEAAEAVLLAQVPQTARVNAKELKAPEVKYAGEPQFKAIEKSSVTYAANCSHDVVKVGGAYYLCYQGVWFSSNASAGPWVVTTSVPKEIYAIPASAPVHNVTYVVVVDADPVYPTYAYTAGYTGVTIAFGCAMYGTGWYYPPYYHYPPYGYPIYYPRPVTYGCGAAYNPWTGGYGYYQHAYGPYGGVARGASYNPYTGTYKRGAMAYGPYGAQGYAQAYNPRTNTYAATRQGSSVYGSWGSSHVQRGDDWVHTQRVTDANGNTRWAAQGSGGGSAQGWQGPGNSGGFVGQSGSGDVYAGRNGEVYRKTDDGWQSWDNGGWNDAGGGTPKATASQQASRPSAQPSAQPAARPSTQPSTQPARQPSAQPASRPSAQPSTQQAKPSTQPSAQPARQPSAQPTQRPAAPTDQLNRDAQSRSQGSQKTQAYGSYQKSGGSAQRGSGGGRRR